MLTDNELEKLKSLLEEQHTWPSEYIFKFIVPFDKVPDVEALFPGYPIQKRASRRGKFMGLTIRIEIESADVVIAIYQKASLIEGLISL